MAVTQKYWRKATTAGCKYGPFSYRCTPIRGVSVLFNVPFLLRILVCQDIFRLSQEAREKFDSISIRIRIIIRVLKPLPATFIKKFHDHCTEAWHAFWTKINTPLCNTRLFQYAHIAHRNSIYGDYAGEGSSSMLVQPSWNIM